MSGHPDRLFTDDSLDTFLVRPSYLHEHKSGWPYHGPFLAIAFIRCHLAFSAHSEIQQLQQKDGLANGKFH